MLGVLCLVGVVIQSDEVEAGLDLITASSKHVLPAHTLSCVRLTAVEGEIWYYMYLSTYICLFLCICVEMKRNPTPVSVLLVRPTINIKRHYML